MTLDETMLRSAIHSFAEALAQTSPDELSMHRKGKRQMTKHEVFVEAITAAGELLRDLREGQTGVSDDK